jgi:hypothetical protein
MRVFRVLGPTFRVSRPSVEALAIHGMQGGGPNHREADPESRRERRHIGPVRVGSGDSMTCGSARSDFSAPRVGFVGARGSGWREGLEVELIRERADRTERPHRVISRAIRWVARRTIRWAPESDRTPSEVGERPDTPVEEGRVVNRSSTIRQVEKSASREKAAATVGRRSTGTVNGGSDAPLDRPYLEGSAR